MTYTPHRPLCDPKPLERSHLVALWAMAVCIAVPVYTYSVARCVAEKVIRR